MKVLPFQVVHASTSDINFPASNLAVLTTQPLGWMSGRFCTYPQELVLQFQSNMSVKKVQFLSHEKKITTKIECFVGRQVVSASDYAVLGRDGLKFERIGYFTFSPNDQSNWQSRELKSVTIDKDGCQFLRLVIHKHHDNRYNLFGQVALVAVRVYGDVEKLAPPSAQRPRFQELKISNDDEQREETYVDATTMQQIYALQYQKDHAVRNEDFEHAKKLKLHIEEIKLMGMQIKELDDRKRFAIQNEDYDTAQQLKRQILEFRVKAGQIDQHGREVKPDMDYLRSEDTTNNQRNPQHQEDHTHQQPNQQPYYTNQSTQQQPQSNYQPTQFPDEQYDYDYQDNDQNYQPDQNNYTDEQDMPQQKPKIVNYDEQIIPALANKNRKDDESFAQDMPILDQAGLTLEQEKLAEPLVPYFTMEFCRMLFSKQWSQREKAFTWLSDELKSPKSIKVEPREMMFQMVLQVVGQGLNDKIEKVIVASLGTLEALLQQHDMKPEQMLKHELPIILDNTMLLMMEKAGDSVPRIKEETDKVLMTMAESTSVGTIQVINHLIRGVTTKPKLQQSARHVQARLVVTYNLIKKYKIKNDRMPYHPIMDFAIRHLDHPAENVRSAAIYIIGESYRYLKDVVRQSLVNVRPAIMYVLDEVFARIDKGQDFEGVVDPAQNRKTAVEQNIKDTKHTQQNREQKQMELLDEQVITECEFCGTVNKEFSKANQLDLHLWRECRMLTTCLSCAQVVEIQSLSTHHLDECEHQNDYRECTRCGVAITADKLQLHLDENVCKQGKGPICPLCFELISVNEGWRNHLMQCKKNDRK